MNKKLFVISILAVLAFSSFLPMSFASTSSTRWNWLQCNAAYAYGNLQVTGDIGQTYAITAWNVPVASYEQEFGCNRYRITDVSITVIVNHPGAVGVPISQVSTASNSALQFPLEIKTCTKYGCTSGVPYNLHYGDSVIVSINVVYNGLFSHGTTYTMRVTQ